MGTIQHNAIIATTDDEASADAFEKWCQDFPDKVTPVLRAPPVTNGTIAF